MATTYKLTKENYIRMLLRSIDKIKAAQHEERYLLPSIQNLWGSRIDVYVYSWDGVSFYRWSNYDETASCVTSSMIEDIEKKIRMAEESNPSEIILSHDDYHKINNPNIDDKPKPYYIDKYELEWAKLGASETLKLKRARAEKNNYKTLAEQVISGSVGYSCNKPKKDRYNGLMLGLFVFAILFFMAANA